VVKVVQLAANDQPNDQQMVINTHMLIIVFIIMTLQLLFNMNNTPMKQFPNVVVKDVPPQQMNDIMLTYRPHNGMNASDIESCQQQKSHPTDSDHASGSC